MAVAVLRQLDFLVDYRIIFASRAKLIAEPNEANKFAFRSKQAGVCRHGQLPLIGTRGNVNNLVPTKGDCNGEAKVPALSSSFQQAPGHRAGRRPGRHRRAELPQGGDQRPDLLPLALPLRWDDDRRGQGEQAPARGEQTLKTRGGRSNARQPGPLKRGLKETSKPGAAAQVRRPRPGDLQGLRTQSLPGAGPIAPHPALRPKTRSRAGQPRSRDQDAGPRSSPLWLQAHHRMLEALGLEAEPQARIAHLARTGP